MDNTHIVYEERDPVHRILCMKAYNPSQTYSLYTIN